jgi:Flp pilus assembly protein TadG
VLAPFRILAIAGRRHGPKSRRTRRGVAAVEFALLLPVLMLLFVLAVDFSRVYYSALTVTNCARAGAIWASDPQTQSESPFASLSAAALADASDLSPTPTVTSATGTDSLGQSYVEVTVTYNFKSISNYLGSQGDVTLARKVRAPVAPTIPD